MPTYDLSLGTYGYDIVLDDGSIEKSLKNADKKVKNSEGKLKDFGKNAGMVATGVIAGLGAALVGVGVAGVNMADDLKQSLNTLQTSTGASDEEMKGLEDSLKNIYNNNYGESFEDIAQSMASVKQNTGLAGEELEKATQNAIALRDTFDYGVKESTNAANSLMKQFGISSEEAFNLIAQGSQNGADKNGDLLDILNEYAPQYKALGFSAEEFTNTLIDGAENGAFSIDKVGDAIKEFNIRAKDGSKSSAEGFQALGLNAEEMTSKFAQGGETAQQSFQQVVTALNKVEDPVKKNATGVALFGTQFEDLEAGAISAFSNIGTKASLSKDTLAQINQIKYDSFGEAIQGIGRNFNTGLLIPLGEMVLPILNTFANLINDQMPVIQSVFSSVFSVISSVTSTMYNFFTENILPILQTFGKHVQDNFPVIQSVFEKVFDAALTVGKTLWDFYKTNLLPIFKDLYEWIKSYLPQVREIATQVFNKVVDVLKTLWSVFKNNILPILAGFYGTIRENLPQIKAIFEDVFTIVYNVIKTVWDILDASLIPVIEFLWKNVIEPWMPKIGQFVEDAFSTIIDIVESTIGVFKDAVEWIGKAIDKLTFWNDTEPEEKTVRINEERTSSLSRKSYPSYDVGTPFVPNDQLAMIHRGEAIIPAKYNPFNNSNTPIQSGDNYTFHNVTVKADNMDEFLSSIDLYVNSE